MSRQTELDRICKSRNLPDLKVGAICLCEGVEGVIVGGNCSNNLDVVFGDNNFVSNCHPHYKFRILNGLGGYSYESADCYE